MPVIRLETFINADQAIVFDLARSIDLHQISTAHTNERAIAGKMSGLIELDESVTWEARHFGILQRLTSKITAMQQPNYLLMKWFPELLSLLNTNIYFNRKVRGH